MAIGSLGSLGAIAYDIIANDETEAGTKSAADRFSQVSSAAGAAATAIGGATVLLTDSARKTNAALGVTALSLGATGAEMRELALSTTNVTFPIEEVTATFDLLARAGMRNQEEIAATATAFDTLGDAIGLPASQVTSTLIPAFNAFNIPLENAADHTDAFTHLVRNTTVDLGDFSTTMKYLTPDLDALGLGLNDTVAIMEALADKGIQGSAATRQFRTAVTAADGDLSELYASLGITADEVGHYCDAVDAAEGMTQAFADAANEQYGRVDKLKQSWEEWTLRLGSALGPLEDVGAALAVGGPLMMGLGGLSNLLPVLSTIHIPALGGALTTLAMNPVVLIVGGIVLAAFALWELEKRFGLVSKAVDFISGRLDYFASWLRGAFQGTLGSAADTVRWFADALNLVWDGLGWAADLAWGGMVDTIRGHLNFLIGLVNTFIGLWNRIKFDVPSVDLPLVGRVGGFSVGVPTIPEIPLLAEGGIVTEPTLAMIGEAGPEAVIPFDRLGQGRNITIKIEGVDVNEVAGRIVRIIRREIGVR